MFVESNEERTDMNIGQARPGWVGAGKASTICLWFWFDYTWTYRAQLCVVKVINYYQIK